MPLSFEGDIMIAIIRQLHGSTKTILNAVRRGKSVWVKSRGKICAKIIPVAKSPVTKLKDEAFGMWKDHKETSDVKSYVRKIRSWHRHAH